jgi:hypothetical protein
MAEYLRQVTSPRLRSRGAASYVEKRLRQFQGELR